MLSYCEKKQCKILALFSPIFVVDTKVTFVYNFVAPVIFCDSER